MTCYIIAICFRCGDHGSQSVSQLTRTQVERLQPSRSNSGLPDFISFWHYHIFVCFLICEGAVRYPSFNSTLHELYKKGQRANGSILISSEGNETFTFQNKFFLFFFWLLFVAACRLCTVAHGASSLVAVLRFSYSKACGMLVPRPGIKPTSLALEGGFSTLDHRGGPRKHLLLNCIPGLIFHLVFFPLHVFTG